LTSGLLTTSWDDGTPEDIDVARLLGRFGFRGTFYASTGPGGRRTIDDVGVRELVTLGHELGNHGRTHRPFTTLSAAELMSEIDWGEAEIARFAPQPRVVAPPKGLTSPWVESALVSRGLTVRKVAILGGSSSAGTIVPTAQFYPHRWIRGAAQIVRRRSLPAAPFLLAWGGSVTMRRRFDALAAAADRHALVLHVWGHSAELERLDLLGPLEQFLERSAALGLLPLTNGELADLRAAPEGGDVPSVPIGVKVRFSASAVGTSRANAGDRLRDRKGGEGRQ
jgi:hypothetical protein